MPDEQLNPEPAPEAPSTLQPVVEEELPTVPVAPPVKVTTNVDAVNRAPQVVEGRVRVSDDISAQAVEAGFEPDVQPKAAAPAVAVSTGVGDSLGGELESVVRQDSTAGQIQGLRDEGKDAEADAIVQHAAAASAALDAIQAPLSVQADRGAQQLVDDGFEVPPAQEPEVAVAPTGGPVEQVPVEPVQGGGALTDATVVAPGDPSAEVVNPGLPPVEDAPVEETTVNEPDPAVLGEPVAPEDPTAPADPTAGQ